MLFRATARPGRKPKMSMTRRPGMSTLQYGPNCVSDEEIGHGIRLSRFTRNTSLLTGRAVSVTL